MIVHDCTSRYQYHSISLTQRHIILYIYIYQQLCNSRHCRPELHCGVQYIYILYCVRSNVSSVLECNAGTNAWCSDVLPRCPQHPLHFLPVRSWKVPTASVANMYPLVIERYQTWQWKILSSMCSIKTSIVWGFFQPCFMTPEGSLFQNMELHPPLNLHLC